MGVLLHPLCRHFLAALTHRDRMMDHLGWCQRVAAYQVLGECRSQHGRIKSMSLKIDPGSEALTDRRTRVEIVALEEMPSLLVLFLKAKLMLPFQNPVSAWQEDLAP